MSKLLTVPEVRDRLGYRKNDAVYHLIATGQLPAHAVKPNSPLGGRPSWRVSEDDLGKYLASIKTTAAQPEVVHA